MAINGYRLFDSDLHVIEPADLWQRYIHPRFKDLAPIGLIEQPFSTGHLHPLDGVPFSPTDEGGFATDGVRSLCGAGTFERPLRAVLRVRSPRLGARCPVRGDGCVRHRPGGDIPDGGAHHQRPGVR